MAKKSNILTPLQLRFYELDEVTVKANPDWIARQSHAPRRDVDIDFDFFAKEHEGEIPMFQIAVTIQINSAASAFKAADYQCKAVLRTYFTYLPSEDEHKTYAPIVLPNGLAMTYSIARGIIAGLTGNGRHGTLFLPTVNMHQVINNKMQVPGAPKALKTKKRVSQ